MAWTIDDAVSNKTLKDTKIYIREVCFRLGELSPKVRVRLFRFPGDKEIYFEQSHFIQTPEQPSSDVAFLKSDKNEAYALTHAVEGLIHPYEAAVAEGHEPSDSWLMSNDDY